MDRYDPWDPATIAEPYEAYRWLREAAPCYLDEQDDFVALSRHEDVAMALKDHHRFSSREGVSLWRAEPSAWISEDPPSHTWTRHFATRAFTKNGLARHEPFVRSLATELVAAAVERGACEVIHDIAHPVATTALCEVLGVGKLDPAAMVRVSEETFVNISAHDGPRSAGPTPAQQEVWMAIDEVVEARKRSGEVGPGDLVDVVIAGSDPDEEGRRFDRLGRSTYLTLLVGPGVETTRDLIGNGMELAARYPDEWARVVRSETTPASWVEETLRFESPVQGFFRLATTDVEVSGGVVPAGARVLALYAAANRDDRVFANADRFDAARQPTQHLAFGYGIHFCIGAGLARLEASAVFAALAAAGVAVVRDGSGQRTVDAQIRGWRCLPVQLHAP